jgi:subtilase family serine protease
MDSGSPIATGYVRFYEAGTTTLKNAYADKDKGSSFTKLALDADSRGVAYGDGIYKLKFYAGDPDNGGTDTGITIDNYKCTAVLSGPLPAPMILTGTMSLSWSIPPAEILPPLPMT